MKPSQRQTQAEPNHRQCTNKPPSLPRKRILSGCPKPKGSAPSGSACIPSTPCNPPVNRKTRDLPNLSECHACGFRTDTSNGKNRIQTLYSEWRIVLLCRKCFSRVESSQICSYCFKEASGDYFCCCQCKRCVHKNCFSKYKTAAPWSYSCYGSEFSVCVDCWVPRAIARKTGGLRSRKMGGKGRGCTESEKSRVLNGGDCVKSLEDVVREANCTAEKKIEAAARAREMAVKKAVVARRAMELASNALGLVSKKDENGAEDYNGRNKVVDDEELAFQLHRAMNSSPRISKSTCAVNSISLAIPKIPECNSDSLVNVLDSGNPSVCGKLEVCTSKKLYENIDKSVSDTSVCVRALDFDSLTNMDCLEGMIDVGIGPKGGECKKNYDAEDDNAEVRLKEGEGSCSSKTINSGGDDNCMDSESQSCQKVDERYNEKPDRYLIKYRKRKFTSKAIPDGTPTPP